MNVLIESAARKEISFTQAPLGMSILRRHHCAYPGMDKVVQKGASLVNLVTLKPALPFLGVEFDSLNLHERYDEICEDFLISRRESNP